MADFKSKMAYEPRTNVNLKEIEEANLPQKRVSILQRLRPYRIVMMFLLVILAALRWIFPFWNLSTLSSPEAHLHATPDLRTAKKPNFIFIMTGMFYVY